VAEFFAGKFGFTDEVGRSVRDEKWAVQLGTREEEHGQYSSAL